MTIVKRLSITLLLALGLGGVVHAQQAPSQADRVDQLDQIVGLSDDQKSEMREFMQESEGTINRKRMEAQELQQSLSEQIGPDYDEGDIRDQADELGEVTGDIATETVLLQARIQDTLTEEQRATLEERARQQREQMRQMQQQMQQQQQGQQQ